MKKFLLSSTSKNSNVKKSEDIMNTSDNHTSVVSTNKDVYDKKTKVATNRAYRAYMQV